jgi:hypothetical protein
MALTKEELAHIMELLIQAKIESDKADGLDTEQVIFHFNDGTSDEFQTIVHDVAPPTDKKKLH